MKKVHFINELYVMKRHTAGIYSDCSIAVKPYSESLYTLFARISDQDRHHAQAFYSMLMSFAGGQALTTPGSGPLPVFRAFAPQDTDRTETAVRAALWHLADAAKAEKMFYERADVIWQSMVYNDFEDILSLPGLIKTSFRREQEFLELFLLVESDEFHGQAIPHICAYCGASVDEWNEECPVCHQPFAALEKRGGYLNREDEKDQQ